MTPEDKEGIRQSIYVIHCIPCFEAMIRKYGNHPFFTAKIAYQFQSNGALAVAERMFREVWAHPLINVWWTLGHLNPLVGQEALGRAWCRGWPPQRGYWAMFHSSRRAGEGEF